MHAACGRPAGPKPRPSHRPAGDGLLLRPPPFFRRTLPMPPLPMPAAPTGRRRSRGIAAMEFALILPLFLTVLFAIISFSVQFGAQQLMTLAAAEGARAALQFQPANDAATALGLRRSRACTSALALVDLIQDRSGDSVSCATTVTVCGHDAALDCLEVVLSYPYRSAPLIPALPFLDSLTPVTMRGTATVQLNPLSLTAAPPAPAV